MSSSLRNHSAFVTAAILAGSVLFACEGSLEGAAELTMDDGVPGRRRDGEVPPEEAVLIEPAPTLHRLNRIEYNNTVRDLTGTTLMPADAFPPDPVANGFDNMAAQLGLGANQMAAYFDAAKRVVDDALDSRPRATIRGTADAFDKQGGYAVGELWALTGNVASIGFDAPVAGRYQVDIVLGASVVGPAPRPTAELRLDGVAFEALSVAGTAASPEPTTNVLMVEAGRHTISIVPTNFVNMAAENTSNNVLLESIVVQSEEIVDGPGRARILVCDELSDDACFRSIVSQFAQRAWRRPVSEAQVDGLVALGRRIESGVMMEAGGESRDDSLKLVLRAVLSSPRFLFRSRTSDDTPSDGWVDPYVLASRLSYFLWSSMPDETLVAAAVDGSLATDDGLRAQARRMLLDPKASALVESFATQWLAVRELRRASPEASVYPTFSEDVRTAMSLEAQLLFSTFLAEQLPFAGMLWPDFVHRNDALAAHYQEPLPGSPGMQQISMPNGSRKGVLGLGSWLTSRSTPEQGSPIRRGAWVADHVLCQPVPPPPAGLEIPELDLGEADSVREQLERHRADPVCASCHERLDIVGMGFQKFDGAAVYREDAMLDSLGELPSGEEFNTVQELAAVQELEAAFARCVLQHLYIYAVGRGVHPKDQPFLDALAEQAAQQQSSLADVVAEIVLTPSFRAATPLEETTP